MRPPLAAQWALVPWAFCIFLALLIHHARGVGCEEEAACASSGWHNDHDELSLLQHGFAAAVSREKSTRVETNEPPTAPALATQLNSTKTTKLFVDARATGLWGGQGFGLTSGWAVWMKWLAPHSASTHGFWYWFYLVLLLSGNIFLIVQTAGLVAYFVNAIWWRRKFGEVCSFLPREGVDTVSIIVPCYMPNEHPIIHETLDHILNRLEYEPEGAPLDGNPAVTVYCVYNAPADWSHEVEETLQQMNGKRLGRWKRPVHVIRVPGSRTKAANLNCAMMQIKSAYTAIYDADHHPDPPSLRIALNQLVKDETDCVQGSTYIREGLGCLGMLIDAEFFANYFVNMLAASMLVGSGWYGGSNALWKTASLQSQEFHTRVQTEDIEFSVQSLLRQAKISFCPQCRSGELPPAGLRSAWRQRIRWMMGWDQVTFLHTGEITRSQKISWRRRLGLYWLLIVRWYSVVMGLVLAVAQPVVLLWLRVLSWTTHDSFGLEGPIEVVMNCGMIPGVFTLLALLGSVLVYERPYPRMFRQLLFCALFLQLGPLYIIFQFCLEFTSFRRIFTGRVGHWRVTQRFIAS